MKLLNKLLNIYIFLLILVIIMSGFIYFVEPMLYNTNSKGKQLENFEDYRYISEGLGQYLMYYKENDIDALKKCTSLFKRAEDSKYMDVCQNYIKNNYNSLQINNIEKCYNNVYIIEYYINVDNKDNLLNEPDTKKVIIKINKSKESFQIYYDSLLDII